MRKLFSCLILLSWAAPATAQDAINWSTAVEYSLRPGDALEITVWGQPEYSGQFRVDETGTIQYPVIGEIDVRSKTVAGIRSDLIAALGEIFNRPFVTVRPRFNIAVLGEVVQPGLFTVDPTLSVLDIVAMAGGASPDGNLNNIRLMRGGQTMSLGLDGGRAGSSLQAVGLRSGDQIVVARRAFTGNDLRTLLQLVSIGLQVAIFTQVRD